MAKVYRDRVMSEMDAVYPGYGFAEHKGYATPRHQAAIRRLGPCGLHRKSFDYIRELCGQYSPQFYELKALAAKVSTQPELLRFEQHLGRLKARLQPMEIRKLQQTARRLWRRIAD